MFKYNFPRLLRIWNQITYNLIIIPSIVSYNRSWKSTRKEKIPTYHNCNYNYYNRWNNKINKTFQKNFMEKWHIYYIIISDNNIIIVIKHFSQITIFLRLLRLLLYFASSLFCFNHLILSLSFSYFIIIYFFSLLNYYSLFLTVILFIHLFIYISFCL